MKKLNERVRLVMESLDLNATEFARALEMDRSALYHSLSGKINMPDKYLQKISELWPDISYQWLKLGTGPQPSNIELEMLKRVEISLRPIETPEIVERIRKAMEILSIENANQLSLMLNVGRAFAGEVLKGEKNFSNEKLKKLADLAQISYSWLLTGEGEMNVESKAKSIYEARQDIPYYDVDVTAGDSERDEDWLPSIPKDFFHIPILGKCDFALPVFGISMMDAYNPGDIVAYREIFDWRNYMEYGNAYLVRTKERRMLKYIRKSSKKNHFLLCSKNEVNGFDPFDVSYDDILNIYIVVGKVEKKII